MTVLHEILADRLPKLKTLLREAKYSDTDIAELTRLFAGLYVLLCFAVDANGFDRKKVNAVLQAQVVSGFSWYAALKYLSGQRAREIFVNRSAVIREIGGSELMYAFNVVLPQARDLVDNL